MIAIAAKGGWLLKNKSLSLLHFLYSLSDYNWWYLGIYASLIPYHVVCSVSCVSWDVWVLEVGAQQGEGLMPYKG